MSGQHYDKYQDSSIGNIKTVIWQISGQRYNKYIYQDSDMAIIRLVHMVLRI